MIAIPQKNELPKRFDKLRIRLADKFFLRITYFPAE